MLIIAGIACYPRKNNRCLIRKSANRYNLSYKIDLHVKDIHGVSEFVEFIRLVFSRAPPKIAFRSYGDTHGR
jgi:hypothetical protein